MENFLKYRKFTRPALADMLEVLGLQYEFEFAQGDLISGTNTKGEKITAYDFLGGYGSTILGHNHPEVLKTLAQMQEKKAVFHSQASVRVGAAQLSERLSQLVCSHTGDTRSFVTTLGNSGAEAVEIAIKHALVEWQNKRHDFILNLKSMFYAQKNASRDVVSVFEKSVRDLNELEPVILAFRGGFHGKTAAAVSVTENKNYSSMYPQKALDVVFVDRNMDPASVEAQLCAFDFVHSAKDQTLKFSQVIGLIFEPIQGEGGIFPLPQELLQTFHRELQKRKVPIMADEIQSGLFRTGRFLASSAMGIKPDYILLGKSLGGAVSKISATMIAENHYQPEFGWVHTSTFAEDEWSAQVALKTLEILENEKVNTLERAKVFEIKIREHFAKLKEKHPQILKEIRGQGFFLGWEFNFDGKVQHSSFLNFIYDNGFATYLFTSFLLHRHGIRVGVTLSAPSTIRLEPSIFISQQAIDKLLAGLSELSQMLQERKLAAMLNHLWLEPIAEKYLAISSEAATPRVEQKGIRRIGFLSHVVNTEYVRKMDRAFAGVNGTEIERFLKTYLKSSSPALYHEQMIEGRNGEKVILNLYGMMTASHQFEADLQNQTRDTFFKVQQAVNLAADDGCEYFGLGQFTSIISQNGLLLESSLPLTTGNSLTAGMAFRAVERIVQDRFQSRPDLKIGVVGFTGNICHVVSQLLTDLNYPMTLVYKEPYATSNKFKSAVESLLANSKMRMDTFTFAHQIESIRDCDIVLIGTNSSKEFITSDHVKSGAVLLDISVPTNVHEDVRKRSDVLYFQGGFARFPFDQKLNHIWTPTYGSKNWFACMSETIICGLLGEKNSFSLGALTKERVLESLKLADEVGIELGDLRRV